MPLFLFAIFFFCLPRPWLFSSGLYRCVRIIGHFTVHRMVGYNLSGSSTVAVGVACELLRDGRDGPWPMAWRFPVW